MSICSFWQLYDNLVPLILSNTFHIGETVTGIIMALDNVLALFLLPLFGSLSDKVHTRLGKRTPFIIIGSALAVLLMMLLPLAAKANNFLLFIISLGLLLIAMGSYRTPAVALMPDVTPKPLRSQANAVINLLGTLGAIFTLTISKVLIMDVPKPDYTSVFQAVALFMVIAVIIVVVKIKENTLLASNTGLNLEEDSNKLEETIKETPLQPAVKKSLIFLLISVFLWFMAYNAVTTAFSRYAAKVWGLQGGNFANTLLVATGAATLSYIPIGFLSGKLGRKKTILSGILFMSFSYFLGTVFTEYSPVIYLVFAMTGIGWAAINVNSYPMVVEMGKGTAVGKYTGLYYTFSMSAQICTPILSGFLLETVSYRTLFPYSVIFSLLSFCSMLLVRHGDSIPVKKSGTLEHFDN
nr:MFS transporter [Anaerocolumna cellulosilytica]